MLPAPVTPVPPRLVAPLFPPVPRAVSPAMRTMPLPCMPTSVAVSMRGGAGLVCIRIHHRSWWQASRALHLSFLNLGGEQSLVWSRMRRSVGMERRVGVAGIEAGVRGIQAIVIGGEIGIKLTTRAL